MQLNVILHPTDFSESASHALRLAVHLATSHEARGDIPRSRIVIAEGNPALEVVRLSEELGVDLIVMSTKGLTGAEHTRRERHRASRPVRAGAGVGEEISEIIDGSRIPTTGKRLSQVLNSVSRES